MFGALRPSRSRKRASPRRPRRSSTWSASSRRRTLPALVGADSKTSDVLADPMRRRRRSSASLSTLRATCFASARRGARALELATEAPGDRRRRRASHPQVPVIGASAWATLLLYTGEAAQVLAPPPLVADRSRTSGALHGAHAVEPQLWRPTARLSRGARRRRAPFAVASRCARRAAARAGAAYFVRTAVPTRERLIPSASRPACSPEAMAGARRRSPATARRRVSRARRRPSPRRSRGCPGPGALVAGARLAEVPRAPRAGHRDSALARGDSGRRRRAAVVHLRDARAPV